MNSSQISSTWTKPVFRLTLTSANAANLLGFQMVFLLLGSEVVLRPTSSQSVAPEKRTMPAGAAWKRIHPIVTNVSRALKPHCWPTTKVCSIYKDDRNAQNRHHPKPPFIKENGYSLCLPQLPSKSTRQNWHLYDLWPLDIDGLYHRQPLASLRTLPNLFCF